MKKSMIFPILIGVLALVLAAALLIERDAPAELPKLTRPPAQNQTQPTAPLQTTAPEGTAPLQTEPTEPHQTNPEQTEPERTEPEQTIPKHTEPPIPTEPLFPMELEGGLLTVRSLFQFTGMNPDADNAFGENIAGIELTNSSDRHMTVAEVTAAMADGTTLTFRAEDVPAGRTVMAFCLEHASVRDVAECEDVYGHAEFDDADSLRTDLVTCTVDGITITVRNVSGTELKDLNVICHSLLDGGCFGGTTYIYNVPTLPAGASTTIHAVDCILGMAEVVRVEARG